MDSNQEYKHGSLTYEKLEKMINDMFFDRPKPIPFPTIYTGLVGYNVMQWSLDVAYYERMNLVHLPKYSWETYKRKYGLMQISVGRKHLLYKIVVDLRKGEKEYRYSVRYGTREVIKTNSFVDALKTVEKAVNNVMEYDDMINKMNKLMKQEEIKARLYGK